MGAVLAELANIMMAASMLLVGFLSLLSLAYAGSGSYTFEGPNYWPIIFPTCNGGRQSPIDIKLSDVQDIYLYNNLKFKNYGAEYTGTFSTYNNTLQWDIDSNKPPQIKGGFLFSTWYNLAHFNIHWGAEDCRGSEHTINGEPFPAEIHFVHYSSKFASLSEAAGNENGLAVVGIFLRLGSEDNALLQ